ncbi:MAG: site-specific integrase [Ruminococcus sp.]|nr:site-specific integrase [Ruminococcus sp.]
MSKVLTDEKIESYKEYLLKEEKSNATIEKYLYDVKVFYNYAKQNNITKEIVLDYKKYLVSKYAVRSVNSKLASLASLFDFLGWSDLKVKNLKLQKQTYLSEDKELTKDEYYRLLNAARNNQRLHLIIETICSTGIRVSELKYFTVESVRKGTIVVNCKNKTRSILVPRKLKDKILKYAKLHNIFSGIVFRTRNSKPMNRSNIWSEMKKLCSIANVNPSKVFPHNLRKLFARTFYGIEKDIAKLADILGHSTIDTTRIYIMSSGNEHRRKIERLGLVI